MHVIERRLHQTIQSLPKVKGYEKADTQVNCGVHNAFTKLFEVLHQAHAWELRALGYSFPRFADCINGINHAGSMPPRRCHSVGLGSSLKICQANPLQHSARWSLLLRPRLHLRSTRHASRANWMQQSRRLPAAECGELIPRLPVLLRGFRADIAEGS